MNLIAGIINRELGFQFRRKSNKNFDFDVTTKSALQVRDSLLKTTKLKDSANSNTINDFSFAYYDAVQDALIEGYEQNMDLFSVLLIYFLCC